MSLALYGHPFSSYTQKVLVALYENATPFNYKNLEEPANAAELKRRWPVNSFPLLVDDGETVVESTLVLEYLHLKAPGPLQLLPADPLAALEVRFLDRFFDLYVMNAMQLAVNGKLTKDPVKARDGLAEAVKKLEVSYAWLEQRLAGRAWATGNEKSMADCAAAPSLFYADWVHPIPAACPVLKAYRAKLLKWPAFARAVDEGRKYRSYFPLGAPDRD